MLDTKQIEVGRYTQDKGICHLLKGDNMPNSWDYAAKFAELAKLAGLEVGENGVIEPGVTFSTDELNEFIGKIVNRYTLVVRPEMTAASTSTHQGGTITPPHAPPVPDVA